MVKDNYEILKPPKWKAHAGRQQMNIVHKGKVDGDTITGSAEIGEMGTMNWTAKRNEWRFSGPGSRPATSC